MFSKQSSVTLNQLSQDKLMGLSQAHPKFVFQHKPFYMANYHVEWVAKYAPSWLCDYNPKWMVQNKADWVAHNRPDILAIFDIDLLVLKNPAWVVNHIPEKIAYSHPELLKEFDQSIFDNHCPEETDMVKKSLSARIKYWVMTFYVPKKQIDPKVPTEYIKAISEPIPLLTEKYIFSTGEAASVTVKQM